IPVYIYDNADAASTHVAKQIVDLIRKKSERGECPVLGLATGSTPLPVYRELIKLYRNNKISFQNVITFNLDEYYPIEPSTRQSCAAYMYDNLFNHIDIKEKNIHIPSGNLNRDEIAEYCRNYENKIVDHGGIDLQLLGIGRTGHIGFNEPGSVMNSNMRAVKLDKLTREDAADDFMGEENVPRQGITMGVSTILGADKIILMAWGKHKANIVAQLVEDNISKHVPATFLQEHSNAEVILDKSAACKLT
ncbi:MAG TPA: glucosamine-6-phosphate deaminase, partial [Balneolaceae bacterium]|nr:glucosamine-6-phosphate deaminase [Balneolaceae bacterium]